MHKRLPKPFFLLPFLFLGGIFNPLNSLGQTNFNAEEYPQNYFHSPLKIPLTVISGFGSFREQHFHSGLDLSTGGKTGLEVFAAGGGYISRIKIQSGGYGKVLYLTHPNGYVSVYAHLSRFSIPIETIIEAIQKKAQQFELDVHFNSNLIPIQTGEIIAVSGNTGNSGGPHLHFEIRDEKTEDIINPLAFGLPIMDHSQPIIRNLMVYKLETREGIKKIIRIQTLPVLSTGSGNFKITQEIILSSSSKYFFGIVAEDKLDGSGTLSNPYQVNLSQNEEKVFNSTLLRFGFEQTRCINSFLDYPAFKIYHQKIERSYIEPGNPLPVYTYPKNRSVLTYNGEEKVKMHYEVADFNGHKAHLQFQIKWIKTKESLSIPALQKEDILIPFISPKTVQIGSGHLFFPAHSLFDSLVWKRGLNDGNQGTLSLGNEYIPIKDSLLLSWKIPGFLEKYANKVYLSQKGGTLHSWLEGDSLKSWIKNFGVYSLKIDTLPPYLIWKNISSNQKIIPHKKYFLGIGDQGSGLQTYNAYLDNSWILMEYDGKNHEAFLTFPDHLSTGPHELKLKLQDRSGNLKEEKRILYF